MHEHDRPTRNDGGCAEGSSQPDRGADVSRYEPEPLTITVNPTASGRITLALVGSCDYETAGELRQAADEALAELPVGGCLTVDLTGVDNTDSSALSALIWIMRCTETDQVNLHLAGVSDHLQGILRITGLDAHFADALSSPEQHHAAETTAGATTRTNGA
ncbi:STAS domain-containing protein [Streptacidiphilus sp. PB12-B1b]|uniref:STAS domain-containing protein n=1 Tax=Streptacidiphilus sp. PB12-B1b TaxID=2705012 RepID=UPI0015F7AC1A|nr:STAS domain-containing protein [Streptacidiphilus sp. PB12-B1b]QMU77112.1 STAS domain-containing protein [Streptacidiphilus sp. PB12-B1b]